MARVVLASLVVDALAGKTSSVTSCGSSSDLVTDIQVEFSPNPLRKGVPFTVKGKGTLHGSHEAGVFDADFSLNAFKIINKEFKFTAPYSFSPALVSTDVFEFGVGPLTIPRTLPGAFKFTGPMKITDSNNSQQVLCLNLDIDIPTIIEDDEQPVQEEALTAFNCGTDSDHLTKVDWECGECATGDATTITGTMDELLTDTVQKIDLKFAVGPIKVPVALDIPVKLPPIIKAGDVRFTILPVQWGETSPNTNNDLLTITGQIKVDDGNGEQVMCVDVGTFVPPVSETPVSV